MKKFITCFVLTVFLAAAAAASEQPQRKKQHRTMRIAQPAYATSSVKPGEFKPGEITPEQRAKFAQARKRRFEIMVLIGAYKIMPVNERQALKNELIKRIREDFNAAMQRQKERIAKAESDLKKLRSELSEREANSEKLIENELDRLLKMQFPTRHNKARKK